MPMAVGGASFGMGVNWTDEAETFLTGADPPSQSGHGPALSPPAEAVYRPSPVAGTSPRDQGTPTLSIQLHILCQHAAAAASNRDLSSHRTPA